MHAEQTATRIPTVTEELERKTVQTVQDLALRLRNGEITEREFNVGMDALWGASAGLVEKSVADLLQAAIDQHKGAQRTLRRLFTHPKYGVVMLQWIVGQPKFYVRANIGTLREYVRAKDFSDKLIPAKRAKEAANALAKQLLSRGYHEIN